MAKASAEGGATHYLAEGDPVPDDLPDGVRLVGPGAPAGPEADVPEAEPGAEAEAPPPDEDEGGQGDGDDDGPPDYMAYRVTDLRELSRDRGLPVTGAKPDLAAALAQWDAEHPDGG